MCDYSLERVRSRPAKIGDRLVTTTFPGTLTCGFAAVEDRSVAVCLQPGTEIAFDENAKKVGLLWPRSMSQKLAIFRKINRSEPAMYHDALEFADGRFVLLTQLASGQYATVLQLSRPAVAGMKPERENVTSVPA